MNQYPQRHKNKTLELKTLKQENARLKQEIKTITKQIIFYNKILKPRNLHLHRKCRFYIDTETNFVLKR